MHRDSPRWASSAPRDELPRPLPPERLVTPDGAHRLLYQSRQQHGAVTRESQHPPIEKAVKPDSDPPFASDAHGAALFAQCDPFLREAMPFVFIDTNGLLKLSTQGGHLAQAEGVVNLKLPDVIPDTDFGDGRENLAQPSVQTPAHEPLGQMGARTDDAAARQASTSKWGNAPLAHSTAIQKAIQARGWIASTCVQQAEGRIIGDLR